MVEELKLDEIRGKALDDVRQWELASRGLFWLGAALEIGLGITFLVLLDFSNSDHILLLFAVATIYSPLVVFLMSVATQLDRNTAKILRALEKRDTKDDYERAIGQTPGP